ncbi:ExeM/NucH family extracellular endonuclease [Paraglaciecola arctica]|uniref:LTD domain-containing protein n=1 Tax=Paraglaciecola arctica BSs20135 TaxID=493475 RepID=K6YTK5_9ALTE|nr:ExeM/NucH family extracellular endonuclease [Paraglaciecola arctica]GAC21492.1 hypothetical protein GARC_4550 [Paraglaciecola arctica BSs20135]
MKLKYPALLALVCAPMVHAEIFFSEYVEGSGNNKALEIYNPTSAVVDLSTYAINLFSNGASTASSSQTLSGTLEPGATFVVITSNSAAADELKAVANLTSSTINHNGDDAYTLTDGSTIVDAFGQVGNDPGSQWESDGVETQNQTLRRKSSVLTGDTDALNLFAPSAEWQEFAQDDFSGLGSHTVDGDVIEDIAPFVAASTPADGDQFVAVTSDIVVSFSETVNVTAWNDLNCSLSGNHGVSITGSGSTYTLNPDTDFVLDESCTLTIFAADVTDVDGTSQTMPEDVMITFTTGVFPLVINELLDDPANDLPGDANGDGTRDSSDDEFVELVNISGSDLDITGWSIADGASTRHVFPQGSVVPADCAIVVFGGGEPTGVFGGAVIQTATSGAIGLNNGGDTVTVSNGSASAVITYGSEGSDQSITRSPDITGEFVQHSSINGALYSAGTKTDGIPFDGCEIPDAAPFVVESSPADGAIEVAISSSISLTFSEAVAVSAWNALSCSVSGPVSFSVEQDENTFVLQPDTLLGVNEVCTLTVPAENVTDLDGSADPMVVDYMLSFTTVAELLSCDATFTLISVIQGAGDVSPMEGENLNVKAVVTAVTPALSGFFVQEESADFDADPLTSEGLFVFNPDSYAVPQLGDVVALKGGVSEFFNKTQLTLTEQPVVCGQGETSSSAVTLPLPVDHNYESVEGMLVEVAQDLVVTNTFGYGRFGQVELSSELRFIPTNLFTPGSAAAIAKAEVNARDVIIMDDANDTQNPLSLPFPTGGLSPQNTLRLNDTVANLIGVVDYRFSTFMINPSEPPIFINSNPRTNEPELLAGNLKVASLNVLNYFTSVGPVGSCFTVGGLECRGANSAVEFERQRDKMLAALIAINADIVGLMEIENNGSGESSAIQDVVNGLNASLGEGTYAVVDAGGPVGTDAIAVAFIYKPAVVSLEGAVAILNSDNSIADDNGPLFVDTKNRPALAQKFSLLENGEEIVVSVNHLKSKGSGCGAGDDDTTTGQGSCNLTRTRAAEALTAFLAEEFADLPTLIIGDLNSYAKEDPIAKIEDAGYTNLVNHFGGASAYSYSFAGEVGYLDHALANDKALSKVVDVTEWHINADEPIVFDYNVEFKDPTNVINYYSADAYRMSDHDPVVIALQLEAAAVIGDWDADGDVDIDDYRGLLRAIQRRQSVGMEFDLNEDGRITTLDARVLLTLCTRARCAA